MKTVTCARLSLVVRIVLPGYQLHNRGDDCREVLVDDAALPVALVVDLNDCCVATRPPKIPSVAERARVPYKLK
jgi:hypothetical protein